MPIEVIDLRTSSPELPQPNTRRFTATSKDPIEPLSDRLRPAKTLTNETQKQSNADWFTLSSSSDNHGTVPTETMGGVRHTFAANSNLVGSSTVQTSHDIQCNDFYFLSDDFDSTTNLDDSAVFQCSASKKRRLSPSPKPAKTSATIQRIGGYKSSVSNIETFVPPPGHLRTGNGKGLRRSKTMMTTALESDPIMFTSSPDPVADAARRRMEKRKDIWDDGEDEFDDVFGEEHSRNSREKRVIKDARGRGVLEPVTGNKLNNTLPDDSSESDLPDICSIPSKIAPKAAYKGSKSALEKYNAGRAAEKKASDKAKKSGEKRASKEAEQERKRLAKEEKARDKEKAAEYAKVNTLRTDKKVSTPEMIVDLPSSLESNLAGQVQRFLGPLQVEHSQWECSVPIIKWRRKVIATYNDEREHWEPIAPHIEAEKHVMCVITAQEFADLAIGKEGDDLDSHVLRSRSKFQSCTIIYLIEGLNPWMRKNRNVKNRQFSDAMRSHIDHELSASQRSKKKKQQEYVDEDELEDALLRLQVMHGVLIHHTAAMNETAEWVVTFTQHISTARYRVQKQAVDTAFCMESGQVKTGDNPSDTFTKMLQEIMRITAPVAYGIAAEYPTVQKLIKGLEEKGPLMLEDCKKSANKDGALTDRRVGPSISKRVYKVFMGRDEESWDV